MLRHATCSGSLRNCRIVAGQGIPRTIEPMSDCTATSAGRWKQAAKPFSRPWTCGAKASITSDRMRHWGGAARAKSTFLRSALMKEPGGFRLPADVRTTGWPAWDDRTGWDAVVPHYQSGGLVGGPQTARARAAGSLVRSPLFRGGESSLHASRFNPSRITVSPARPRSSR